MKLRDCLNHLKDEQYIIIIYGRAIVSAARKPLVSDFYLDCNVKNIFYFGGRVNFVVETRKRG